MKLNHHFFLALFILLFQSHFSLAGKPLVDALIVVDIDGTLGDQTTTAPAFSDGTVAKIDNDESGNFYYYPGAVDFMKSIFASRKEAATRGKVIEIALFTMASGKRNTVIRDFLEDKLGLKRATLGLFDYSDAVFSQKVVDMWHNNDPALSNERKAYFDSLEKAIVAESLEGNAFYKKDLSKLLKHYPGLALENIALVDDNEHAVPATQTHQLIIFGDAHDYKQATQRLQSVLVAR